MQKVFIVHGFHGSPNGGWRPWLMGELAKDNVYACALPMPSPNHPKVDKWVKNISFNVGNPDKNTFLIGHSIGVSAALRYLETLPLGTEIGGAVLVSGSYENLKDEAHKELDPFFESPFDFEYIKKVCPKFTIIHSSDDDVVSINNAILLGNKLSSQVVSLEKGGHFGDDECSKFPELLEEIKNIIK